MTADPAALFGVERREPVRAPGVVSIVLGGILRVQIPAAANEGVADVDPKAWRRAVSMVVEQAIVNGRATDSCNDVSMYAAFDAESQRVREMGRALYRDVYCGERKRRRAMRRLLRAAGVTVRR